jgi:hypothetical protein
MRATHDRARRWGRGTAGGEDGRRAGGESTALGAFVRVGAPAGSRGVEPSHSCIAARAGEVHCGAPWPSPRGGGLELRRARSTCGACAACGGGGGPRGAQQPPPEGADCRGLGHSCCGCGARWGRLGSPGVAVQRTCARRQAEAGSGLGRHGRPSWQAPAPAPAAARPQPDRVGPGLPARRRDASRHGPLPAAQRASMESPHPHGPHGRRGGRGRRGRRGPLAGPRRGRARAARSARRRAARRAPGRLSRRRGDAAGRARACAVSTAREAVWWGPRGAPRSLALASFSRWPMRIPPAMLPEAARRLRVCRARFGSTIHARRRAPNARSARARAPPLRTAAPAPRDPKPVTMAVVLPQYMWLVITGAFGESPGRGARSGGAAGQSPGARAGRRRARASPAANARTPPPRRPPAPSRLRLRLGHGRERCRQRLRHLCRRQDVDASPGAAPRPPADSRRHGVKIPPARRPPPRARLAAAAPTPHPNPRARGPCPPRQATIIAAIFEFGGAMLLGRVVTGTIAGAPARRARPRRARARGVQPRCAPRLQGPGTRAPSLRPRPPRTAPAPARSSSAASSPCPVLHGPPLPPSAPPRSQAASPTPRCLPTTPRSTPTAWFAPSPSASPGRCGYARRHPTLPRRVEHPARRPQPPAPRAPAPARRPAPPLMPARPPAPAPGRRLLLGLQRVCHPHHQ